DVDRDLQLCQVIQKLGGKERLLVVAAHRCEKPEVVLVKTERLNIAHRLLQTRRDRVTAIEGILAKVEMKDRSVTVLSGLPVAVGHRQLVEIGEKRGGERHATS